MCTFVKQFYMCSDCLVFVCGLEHTFVSTQNHTQIVVHICKSYFSLADHVIHICDQSYLTHCYHKNIDQRSFKNKYVVSFFLLKKAQ